MVQRLVVPAEGLWGRGFIQQELNGGDGGWEGGEDNKCKGPEVMRSSKQAVEAQEPW